MIETDTTSRMEGNAVHADVKRAGVAMQRGGTAMKSIGRIQRHVLRSMATRNAGVWYPGCGWYWDNVSGTVRVMESLARRGLVKGSICLFDDTRSYYRIRRFDEAGRHEVEP